jgi:hypothetical protein
MRRPLIHLMMVALLGTALSPTTASYQAHAARREPEAVPHTTIAKGDLDNPRLIGQSQAMPAPVVGRSLSASANGADASTLPLAFIPNMGQTDPAVRFQVKSMGGMIFFTPGEVVLSLPAPSQTTLDHTRNRRDTRHGPEASRPAPNVLRLRFAGANVSPNITGVDSLPGSANFLIGNDPSAWHTDLPTYAGIVYGQLYSGVDLRYDGAVGRFKSTYTVAPGADPTRIRWHYDGATGVQVDAAGNLLIALPPVISGTTILPAPTLIEQTPTAWQTIAGQRVPVAVHYTLALGGSISFVLGAYNPTQPLTIDPALNYSTPLGGVSADAGLGIAVDNAGSAYVTGETSSLNFPTAGAPQPISGGAADAFVSKLNADGTALVYSTYLGGNKADAGYGIAVASDGTALVTGYTLSSNFPLVNAYQGAFGGFVDAFVARLSTAGNALLYSTYLGSSGRDSGYGIASDGASNAFVTGTTDSANFPTVSARQSTKGGSADAFVTELNGAGSLVYSTYHGGSAADEGFGIAVDGVGNAYITGYTYSYNFPTASPYQSAKANLEDAFVSKLSTGYHKCDPSFRSSFSMV